MSSDEYSSTFSITSNSRMMYAFARDGGIPGHKFFNYVSPQWKSPIRTGELKAGSESPAANPSFSMASVFPELHSRSSKSWQYRCILCCNLHCHDRTLHLLRHPNRSTSHLSREIHAWAIPLAGVLVSCCYHRDRLDCVHLYCVHPSSGQREFMHVN